MSDERPKPEGTWPERCEQRAFVKGAAWWEIQRSGGTMWASDRDKAEAAAQTLYGATPVTSPYTPCSVTTGVTGVGVPTAPRT